MANKSKSKSIYRCSECGVESVKWVGKCPGCGQFDTMIEHVVLPETKGAPLRQGYAGSDENDGPEILGKVDDRSIERISTGLNEFDRVLGSVSPERREEVPVDKRHGLVIGSTVLIAGPAGAGKSTLLLQTACNIAGKDKTVVYFSGEESKSQIKDRAQRLGLPTGELLVSTKVNIFEIRDQIKELKPSVVIIDSIQAVYHPEITSEPGGASQVKNCAIFLNRLAKDPQHPCAIIIVGHMIKNDDIAGPETLKHAVDAELRLSSTDDARYRVLQANKNRFGSIEEAGFFLMTAKGMRVVDNPSAIFLSRAIEDAPGSVVVPLWAGTRPMLVEVQALVDASTLNNPRRVAVGLDEKKVAVLLAVLHKHAGLVVADQDVYASVVGGIKVTETSADLPLMMAIISSLRNVSIHSRVLAFGEVGLLGEVRPCPYGQERLREASKLGFRKAIIPIANMPTEPVPDMDIYPVATLAQAVEHLADLQTVQEE